MNFTLRLTHQLAAAAVRRTSGTTGIIDATVGTGSNSRHSPDF
jgi:hypothetical protein